MSAPVGSSGSQTAAAQSVCSRPQTRARVAASSETPPSDSAEPLSDSESVGYTDVLEIEDEVPVGIKRKLSSEVWREFDLINVYGTWKAGCQWCGKHLDAEGRNGTTHLKNHLAVCQDRAIGKGLEQSTLELSANPEDGTVVFKDCVFDQDAALKELALMIIVHEYPLSIVEHFGFRRFCAALQPEFEVVSRSTIRKIILDMYQAQKQSMVNYIKNLSSRVALTSDLWAANDQRRSYMAVTAHFLDDDWKLKSFLIRFIYVPVPYTAEVITNVLHDVLLDWHIERNVSTINLGNCAVNDNLMKNMIGTVGDDLAKNKAALVGKFVREGDCCAAHILNLAAKDGMSVMEKEIESVRDSVAYWSATPERHEEFEKMAAQMKGKYEKRIALDCKTRWNSTYIMLSTALIYQDVFEHLASRAPSVPTEDDWKCARELCDRLKVFYDVTQLLSGTKYVTANLVFPKICNIFWAIRKWQSSDVPKVEEMSIKMKEKFNKYWSDVHGLMAVAAVLDPRYKLQLLNALFLKIHGLESVAMEAVNKVKDLLYNLVLDYQDSMEDIATTDGAQTRPTAPTMGGEDWMDTFDDYMSKLPAMTSTVRRELDLYLEEPLLPRTLELDIIQWWQHAGLKYPKLRKIARDILAIPVTTVKSESVFSTNGRIISPQRSRLAPSMIEALMCMQAWSHAGMLGSQSTFAGAFMTCLDEKDEMDEDDSSIIDE